MAEKEDMPKPESSSTALSERTNSKSNSDIGYNTGRNKYNKNKSSSKFGFRQKEQRRCPINKEEQLILDKLAQIKSPTINLPFIKNEEKKFSGRSRLFIGNLPPKVNEEEFKGLFKKYGEVDEIFINRSKGFGFIKLDYSINAERAKAELHNYNYQGHSLIVKSAHLAGIRVKNLPAFTSNELLHLAFSVFGEIDYAYIVVDRYGKPTGEGIVEYIQKYSANLAKKHCDEGCFFLTSSLKPIVVELYEPASETIGYPEMMIRKTPQYYQEREVSPRFASPGSFIFNYAQRWKELHQKYKEKEKALKSERLFEEQKLEADMMNAQFDHETERLKELLRIREMDKKRLERNWSMWQHQIEKRYKFDDDSLVMQANELNLLLDNKEDQYQNMWHTNEYANVPDRMAKKVKRDTNTSQRWMHSETDHSFEPPEKRLHL